MREKKLLNVEIGSNIKKERERAHLTQEVLSEMIEMGTTNLSDVERGVVGISFTTLLNICEALHVSSDRILFGAGSENDVTALAEQLGRLTPEQYEIAYNMLSNLFRAFALNDKEKKHQDTE